MKSFAIQDRQLFFENTWDVVENLPIGFLPDELELALLNDHQNGYFSVGRMSGGGSTNRMYVQCDNYARHNVCNWMIPVEDADSRLCPACRLNQMIPNLSQPNTLYLWSKLETAKRRLIYALLRLGLPVKSKQLDPENGLAFRFLEDEPSAFNPQETFEIMTGHFQGVITLNVGEADDARREAIRTAMGEDYRTLLGHFRHESGHYYWDRLIRDTPRHQEFREIFGDESADYQQSVQTHHAQGPPDNWQENYVSAYAASHPWEDWAECWSHYLYMIDALEFAQDNHLLQPVKNGSEPPKIFQDRHGPLVAELPEMLRQWLHVSTILNSLNRIAGIIDPNPFILSTIATRKMQFVHDAVVNGANTPVGSHSR